MLNAILFKFLKILASLTSGPRKNRKLFILIYHRVIDKYDFMRPNEVNKQVFTWQMELLSKYFNVLSLHDALEKIKKNTLPSRAVCITFDDGYADNYNTALPILRQFNLTATFFIASGFLNGGRMWNDTIVEAIRNFQQPDLDLRTLGLGTFDVSDSAKKCQAAEQLLEQIKHLPPSQRDEYTAFIAAQSQNLPADLMMTTEQVVNLHKDGMEIGGHTINHPILANLDNQTAKIEIVENKTFLESILKTSLSYFAYPNGKPLIDYSLEHVQIVKDAGYQAAFSTQRGTSQSLSDIWQLPRSILWDKSPLKFMLRIISFYIKS